MGLAVLRISRTPVHSYRDVAQIRDHSAQNHIATGAGVQRGRSAYEKNHLGLVRQGGYKPLQDDPGLLNELFTGTSRANS